MLEYVTFFTAIGLVDEVLYMRTLGSNHQASVTLMSGQSIVIRMVKPPMRVKISS